MKDYVKIIDDLKSYQKNIDYIDYSEYLAENLDKTIKYSEYLAKNMDKTIKYSEYVSSYAVTKIDPLTYDSHLNTTSPNTEISTNNTKKKFKGTFKKIVKNILYW